MYYSPIRVRFYEPFFVLISLVSTYSPNKLTFKSRFVTIVYSVSTGENWEATPTTQVQTKISILTVLADRQTIKTTTV